MKLTRTETQFSLTGIEESTMAVTVEYDTAFCEVVKLLSITVKDCKSEILTDVTCIFREQYPEALEVLINEIPWYDLYQERNKTQFRVHDEAVVIHDSIDVFKILQSHFD